MKVYVAGKFSDKERVRTAMESVRSRDHTITYDWTRHTDISQKRSREDFAVEASADFAGVRDADAVIAIMEDPKYAYRGTFFELGAAVALGKRIFIVTPYLKFDPEHVDFHKVCFFHLDQIRHVATFEEALSAL